MRKELKRLIELDREVGLLGHINALLDWDQNTYMPPKAVDERSEQLALIEGLAHDKSASPEVGDLLSSLGSTTSSPLGDPGLGERERAYLRVLRRNYDRATRLPADLVAELARATSLGLTAWVEARTNDDFPAFAPRLERIVELKRREAACLSAPSAGDPHASSYDALLDHFEPGATEASIRRIFSVLRGDLVKLLGTIASRPQVDDSFLRRPCPTERQEAVGDWLMGLLAYDRERGRLDTVAHPFMTRLGADDVRITTSYSEEFFPSSLFSTFHEVGHALYELGMAPGADYGRTRLHAAASMGIHESQSRMWENMIGRSGAFWKGNYARLAELSGGAAGPLHGVGPDAFVRAINKVEPSLIRTEADEVTYGLHVILRFELEAELFSGSLAVADLPAAWKAGMKELLGVEPPDDASGCLQDVHWSVGAFGYFPSYALGNLYAAQFWSAMRKAMPDLEARIESGDLASPLAWLRANIHEPGAAWLPGELVRRVTGGDLESGHFTSYLNEKYSRVYGF